MIPAPPERPSYDQALKRALFAAPDGFLSLIAPHLAFRGDRSSDLPAVSRVADLVWEVQDAAGNRGLLDIELQLKAEPDIGERQAEYGIRLYRRDHLPVRSIIIFLKPIRKVPRSPFVVAWMGEEVLRYSFQVVCLWKIPAERVLATRHVQLWPLAGLMAGATARSVVVVGERIAAAPLLEQERRDLTGLLVLLAGMRFSARSILEALRRRPMLDNWVKESGVATVLMDEARAQGRQAGREEGREEAMRKLTRLVLEGRFGSLDADLRARLEQADAATLEALSARLGTDTLQQIRARLDLS